MIENNYFKVGGSLRYGHPTYITRQADQDLYRALHNREFCYVLNSRQMGKSSLRVRTMKLLSQEGFKCVAIDLGILGRFATPEQWYGGLLSELWRKLRLGQDDDLVWWRSHQELSPVQRLNRFIEDILLVRCPQNIVIFLDEVDNIINLDFRDELLILLRECYEKRVEVRQYARLTFCLLGVATPSSLRINKQLSPFNIGTAIQLEGFNFNEAKPLLPGLAQHFKEAERLLAEVLFWTKGQPFLTQKLCALAVNHRELVMMHHLSLEPLVKKQVVANWELQDEPEHLKTIRDRLLNNNQDQARLLTLYQRMLRGQGMTLDGSEEQIELRLSGLVTNKHSKLQVNNPIYQLVFNQFWLQQQLAALSPFQNALTSWLKSDCHDTSRLLRGAALAEAQTWAKKYSISTVAKDFLALSEAQALIEQEQARLAEKTALAERKLAQEKKLVQWQKSFILLSLAVIGGVYLNSRQVNLSNIKTLVQSSQAWYASDQKLDSLIAALQAKKQLNKSWRINRDLHRQVDTTLQKAVFQVEEYDRLSGHDDYIYSVAISDNGKLMATGATDHTVKLWHNSPEGWQPKQAMEHDGWVLDVAISPDLQTIASASRDRTVKLWNQQGELLDTLHHEQAVTTVVFAESNHLVTGTGAGKIEFWHQGRNIKTLDGHTRAINALAITPQGQIISGSEDGSIKVWHQGREVFSLQAHNSGVRALALNQDGTKIVSASRDQTLKIWRLNGTEPPKKLATLQGHTAPVYGVAINPLNEQIVSASADQTLKIWNRNGTELKTLRGHTNRVWDVTYTPQGHIASASWDKTVRLWQPDNELVQVLSAHRDVTISLDYGNDFFASTSDDQTVKLWNFAGTLLHTFRQHTAEVYDVAINHQTVATVGADRNLMIWNSDGKLLHRNLAHQSAIWAVEMTPDGQKIITGADDNLIKIWNLQGQLEGTLKSHQQKIWDLAMHPGGQQFASASEDHTIRIWDLAGNLVKTLIGHQDSVRAVAYNSQGNLIVSGSEDRSLKIWQSNQPPITLQKHEAGIIAIAISPDNQYIASADDDGTIILWHRPEQTWQPLQTLPSHGNSIWAIAFDPDSKTLASAGEDTKITLWNLDNILQLDTMQYGCDWVKSYLKSSAEVTFQQSRLCS